MTELIVAGEAFNVLVEGEENAPVLMLSNSLGTNVHMWDTQIEAFTKHFRVVRYDARGHGRSAVTDAPYSIAELGRDALAIMDALGLEKVNWLGLSMGGMVGQWLLINAPEQIERAVLANTAAQIGSPDLWNNRIQTVRERGVEALAEQVVGRWFTESFRTAHPGEVATILNVLAATPDVGYAASCAAIRDMDLLADLHSVSTPALVIVGRHDPATPPAMGELIADAIPGAELVVLDTAHLSNIEDSENFNRAVLAFLTAKSEPQVAEAAIEVEEESIEAAAIIMPKKPRRKQAARKAALPEEAPEAEPVATSGDEFASDEPASDEPASDEPADHAPADHQPANSEYAAEAPESAAGIEAPLPEPEAEPSVAAKPARRSTAAAARRRPIKKAAAKRSTSRAGATRASTTKKAPAKKAAAKKAAVKKAAAKKTSARKAVAKKPATRTAARKTAAGRAAAKKTPARKVAARKSAVRKAVTKKTVTKKAATKKAVTRKAAVKRGPAKKTIVKKTVAKKAVASKRTAASKRTVAKKLAPRKVAAKKTAVKKTAKKVAVKKATRGATRKTAARKTAARRGPARKTPKR